MSCSTSTWPSQPGPAPIPMVGIVRVRLISAASGAGTSSSTIEEAPAASTQLRVGPQPVGLGSVPAPDPVAAELVNRLRRQADVPHDRYPHPDQGPDGLGHPLSPFKLDSLRAGLLHDPPGVAQGLFDRHLVGQEGQIHEHQRATGPAAHGGGMIDHLIEGGAQRGFVAGDHLVERVADQEHVHDSVEQLREQRIVARQDRDFPVPRLELAQIRDGQGLRFVRHSIFLTEVPSTLSARLS